MGWKRLSVLGLLAGVATLAAWQGTHPVTGREIANVMGAGGWRWLVRPERAEEEKPDLALELIGVEKGMTVGDVGAGVGYFSLRMARRVGPDGLVYANDIRPKMLELLRTRAAEQGITNIRTVLGDASDPKLLDGQLDLILLVDVYHEFSDPRAMLRGIRKALKPGGRLVLLEYRKEDPSIPILEDHKMTVQTVRRELESEEFEFDELLGALPRQHILIFRKPGD